VDAADSPLLANQSLAHFTAGDYRVSRFYFRHLEFAMLLLLSVQLVWWAQPANVLTAAAKAGITVTVLLTFAAAVALQQPFVRGTEWKLHVKVGSLLLSALAAVTNFFTYWRLLAAVTSSEDAHAMDDAPMDVVVLSYATFAGCIALFCTLFAGFWATLVRGARREAQAAASARSVSQSEPGHGALANPLFVARSRARQASTMSSVLGAAAAGRAGSARRRPRGVVYATPSSHQRATSSNGGGGGEPGEHANAAPAPTASYARRGTSVGMHIEHGGQRLGFQSARTRRSAARHEGTAAAEAWGALLATTGLNAARASSATPALAPSAEQPSRATAAVAGAAARWRAQVAGREHVSLSVGNGSAEGVAGRGASAGAPPCAPGQQPAGDGGCASAGAETGSAALADARPSVSGSAAAALDTLHAQRAALRAKMAARGGQRHA
jgi:hypothetical protein